MMRRQLAAVAALVLLAAGCATDPTVSDAPPAASPGSPTSAPTSASLSPSTTSASLSPSAAESSTPPPSDPSATDPEDTAEAAAVACEVPPRFDRVVVSRLDLTDKLVALTFDAGANGDGVKPILDTLEAREVPATFFLTGRFVVTYPGKSQRTARQHLVGNHTFAHPDLTTLPDFRVVNQVVRAERVIRDSTGEDPRRFFRFPFGARDAHTIGLLNDLCYVPFRWTVDTLGWKGTSGGMTVTKVVDRVLAAAEPGAIVLMHVGSNPDDGSTLDADALPIVIRKLRARGYSFVRLSKVLAPAP